MSRAGDVIVLAYGKPDVFHIDILGAVLVIKVRSLAVIH